MKSPKEGKLLYHLTALENLQSILDNGLMSRKELEDKRFIDIADHNIIDDRTKFGLEHYIPFHFFQKTPFAGKVMVDNTDKSFIYLTLKRELAKENNFKIITKHPLCKDAEICEYDDGFEKIEWNLMENDKKQRDYNNEEISHACMAECIGNFDKIPLKYFHSIHVKTESDKEIVKKYLEDKKIKIFIDISPTYFV